ncbi:cytochrome c4 [Ectothiorhodospiraceae bacterium BW-2]|nr:cytochrome c4 [Ectothiorhodospiraceae bacterium BW-2]
MKKEILAALVLVGLSSSALAAGNAAAGKTKSATCTACHNADGNSTLAQYPKLAGQHASYIANQLAAFKSGERKDPIMAGMAAPLSEQDMADLGAYFATQTTAIGSATPEKAILGKQLYYAGDKDKNVPACMSCHGPNGVGNPAALFPSLSGQHIDYTVKALQDFRSGLRVHPMMNPIADKMNDTEIGAVADFISGLH